MSSIKRITFLWAIVLLLNLVCGRNASAPSGFVQTRNSKFVLNGSPFLFNGFNSYWMMVVATQPSERCKVVNAFSEAAAAGLSVCRTWAFSEGGDQALQPRPGVYNEQFFQGLDFVVSEAGKHGIHLILSLSNNWPDYGGKSQYANWSKEAGEHIKSEDDFFTNAVAKGYYKNHVKKVLTRINTITGIAYKDDPTIMAWELMNEPRCQADTSGKTIDKWVQEMAAHVKSIDNKHLLGIGMEGFYGESVPDRQQNNPGPYLVGTDFITNHQVKEIDFTTIHAYPDQWLSGQNESVQMQFLQRWLTSHWADSMSILDKPMIFSEFGKSSKNPGYCIKARDSYLNTVYTSIYILARDGGVLGGGLVWQVMAEGMQSFYDGYEIVLSQNPSTRNVMFQQSNKMTTLARTLKLKFGQLEDNTKH